MKNILVPVTSLLLIAILLLAGSCGSSGASNAEDNSGFFVQEKTSSPPTETPAPTATSAAVQKPAGLETGLYTNDEYLFSIEVPQGWTLKQEQLDQYIIFKWLSPSGDNVPDFSVTVRQYMQPILISTFMPKYQAAMYNETYKETAKTETTYQSIACDFTMTLNGNAVTGFTVYNQHGNNFNTVGAMVNSGDDATLAILKYCAGTYFYHKKTG